MSSRLRAKPWFRSPPAPLPPFQLPEGVYAFAPVTFESWVFWDERFHLYVPVPENEPLPRGDDS